jgi:hypothetical protein
MSTPGAYPSSGTSLGFAILARLNKAIDFDAIDGEPVDIVCLLLLPTDTEEVGHALACAARVLRDAEALRNLHRAADHTEAYRALVAPINLPFETVRHRAGDGKRREQEVVCPNCKKPASPNGKTSRILRGTKPADIPGE